MPSKQTLLPLLVFAFILSPQSLSTQEVAPVEEAAPAKLPEGAPIGMRFIDQSDLKKHAFYLASDALGGRYTGTVGQRDAAQYLAANLEALGYAPMGDIVDGEHTYFQNWPVKRTYLDLQNSWVRVGRTTAGRSKDAA